MAAATAAAFEDDDAGIKNGPFGEATLRLCLSRLFGLFPVPIDLREQLALC
jgi:hypothetical protein